MKDVFQGRKPLPGFLFHRGLCWKEGEGAIDQVELSMMLNPDDMHLTPADGRGEQVGEKEGPFILMAPVREGDSRWGPWTISLSGTVD